MTIAEACKLCAISADTLRYYEREGLLPPIRRTPGGIRDYSEHDLDWIRFAQCMRAAGLPIGALSRYVSLVRKGDSTLRERKEILARERARLAERLHTLQETLAKLDGKIADYDRRCLAWEREHLRR